MSGSDFLFFVQFYMLHMTSLNQYMPHMQINVSVFQLMTSSFQQRNRLSVCLVEMKSSFAYHFPNLTYMFLYLHDAVISVLHSVWLWFNKL